MLIYLIVFFISSIFFRIGKGKKRFNIPCFIGLIIPSLLAAMRNVEIGTDTEMYYHLYQTVIYNDTYEIPVEPIYIVFSKIGMALSGFSGLLFLYQFVSAICVYNIAYDHRRELSVWLVMLLFFLLFFNLSLNIMRQCTAASYLLYIFRFLEKDRVLTYIILSFIGLTIHSSLFIGALLLLLMYRCVSEKYGNCKNKYVISYIICLILIQVFFLQILSVFENFSYASVGNKISLYSNSGNNYVSLIYYFIPLLLLLIIFIHPKYLDKSTRTFIILLIFTDMSMNSLSIYNKWFFRLTFYFNIFYCLFFPMLCRKIKNFKYLIISIFIFIWWYIYAFRGSNDTIPYVFT